jgi:hypothetical protein
MTLSKPVAFDAAVRAAAMATRWASARPSPKAAFSTAFAALAARIRAGRSARPRSRTSSLTPSSSGGCTVRRASCLARFAREASVRACSALRAPSARRWIKSAAFSRSPLGVVRALRLCSSALCCTRLSSSSDSRSFQRPFRYLLFVPALTTSPFGTPTLACGFANAIRPGNGVHIRNCA